MPRKTKKAATPPSDHQKPLAEQRFARELEALEARDKSPKPAGWRLSPRAVSDFLLGRDKPLTHPDKKKITIEKKFYGDDALIERAVITLTTMRGLMLVGEPGTAKSMLSELLAAAICGDSTLTIQGSAGTSEDQVRYGWNYALLLSKGPCPEALVPAPLLLGMTQGKLVRFEEITRCPPEVQDVLLSPLSERLLVISELDGEERLIMAQPGFNVIATANTRDRGVNDMSAALKRRFNFETAQPIKNLKTELALVQKQTNQALAEADVPVTIEQDVAELLVTTFQELRLGITADGDRVDKPTTPMSTAEAVTVAISSGMHSYYYGGGKIEPNHLARHLIGAVLKDEPDDHERLMNYFNRVVRRRAKENSLWEAWYESRKWLQ